jgi:hypothetical protein
MCIPPSRNALINMTNSDFTAFRALLFDVHQKAFGEPLTFLPYGKAQTLSFLIQEQTGAMLSYKSLANYSAAALTGEASGINPNASTLSILSKFIAETNSEITPAPAQFWWFQYKKNCAGLSN